MEKTQPDVVLSLDCVVCGDMIRYACVDCEAAGYCSEKCAADHWEEEHRLQHEIGLDATSDFHEKYKLVDDTDPDVHFYEPIARKRAKKWMSKAVEHPGSFARAAKAKHMSTAEYARHVLADDKHKYYTMHRFRQAELYKRFQESRHR